MNKIEKGILLIAEPFLKDIHFQRSVVLLCQHEEAGTFGISINMLLNNDISTYIEEFEGHNIPVYDGGPVNRNHIHFLHQYPDLIPGGEHIIDGIFWGGNYEIATTLIKNGSIQDVAEASDNYNLAALKETVTKYYMIYWEK